MSNRLNTHELRKHNMTLIKDCLKSMDSSTKNAIASMTGLSVATCGNLLKLLIKTGEVIELDLAPSTGGRPSRQFQFNASHQTLGQMILSKVDSSYTIVITLTDLLGKQLYKESTHYDTIEIDHIIEIIKTTKRRYETLSTMAIGIPGVVNDGQVDICDIKSLENFNILQVLRDKFDLTFFLENDVNATALGFHQASNTKNFAYIYMPYKGCPGAGIIVNNQIIRGTTNFAGEVGYLPLKEKEVEMHLAKIVASITCIINPDVVVISGSHFEIDSVEQNLNTLLPGPHRPQLLYEEDIKKYYLKGLTLLG